MKKIFLLSIILMITVTVFGQQVVNYKMWSNPTTFQLSPTPVITGFGEYSDSLSDVYDGKIFFASNNEYYQIESWADYYYWFTQKYWYKFKQPEIYEYFYLTENDYEMARYIATQYEGKYYPAKIQIELEKSNELHNRTMHEENFTQTIKDVHNLKKDLKSVFNLVEVRTYSYDNNASTNKDSKSKDIDKKRFDYDNPQSSGIRTFQSRQGVTGTAGKAKPSKQKAKSRVPASQKRAKPQKK